MKKRENISNARQVLNRDEQKVILNFLPAGRLEFGMTAIPDVLIFETSG